MTRLISRAIARVSSLLKGIQVRSFVAVVLVGFLLLTTNIDSGRSNKAVTKKLDEVVHQDDSQRPKTIGEWEKEGRETENAPGERIKRIGKESAEAVKDFGEVYPDTAKRSARSVEEYTK